MTDHLSLKLACTLVMSSLMAAAPAHAAPAPLTLGIQDPVTFQGDLPAQQRTLALGHAAQAGASIVRLGLSWRDVETSKPPSRSVARDPAWAGYRWAEYDREVRAALAAGMEPMLVPASAPSWAEGPDRPPLTAAAAGTWRPRAQAFADFTRALATRYSGATQDEDGVLLPRVRYFQAWNEPNLSDFLTPQSAATAHGRVPVVPGLFRKLVNAMYGSVKAVNGSNVLVAGGLAPSGRYPPLRAVDGQLPPLYFMRKLLCVNARGTHASHCPRTRFDAFAIHLYPQADPRTPPLNGDDVKGRLGAAPKLLRLAARAGTIASRRIWVTEFAISGGSNRKLDVSTRNQARFLELGLYLLWRDGARVVVWFNLRDRAAESFIVHTGLFTLGDSVEDDKPKPARDAFRFPFVVSVSGRGRRAAWGLAPASGAPVTIEQANGRGGWKRVARFAAGPGRVFSRPMPKSGRPVFRARQGSLQSLAFRSIAVTR